MLGYLYSIPTIMAERERGRFLTTSYRLDGERLGYIGLSTFVFLGDTLDYKALLAAQRASTTKNHGVYDDLHKMARPFFFFL